MATENNNETQLSTLFNEVAEKLRQNKSIKLDNQKKLKFYGLYKVVTTGPYSEANKIKAGFFDFETKYKNEAWQKCSIYSKKDAMIEYIKYYSQLYNDNTIDLSFLTAVPQSTTTSIDSLTLDIPADFSSQSTFSLNMASQKEEMEAFLSKATAIEKQFQPLKDEIYQGEIITEEAITKFEKANSFSFVHFRDSLGQSILHIAVDAINFSCVDCLIKLNYAKELINTCDNVNMTPMHIAAINFDIHLYELLLSLNPDKTIKDNEGKTCIDYLEENEDCEIPKKYLRKE